MRLRRKFFTIIYYNISYKNLINSNDIILNWLKLLLIIKINLKENIYSIYITIL